MHPHPMPVNTCRLLWPSREFVSNETLQVVFGWAHIKCERESLVSERPQALFPIERLLAHLLHVPEDDCIAFPLACPEFAARRAIVHPELLEGTLLRRPSHNAGPLSFTHRPSR